MHIDPLSAVAHLAAVDDARVDNRPDRQIEIGVVHDDSGRFAAQLQRHFGHVLRGGGHRLNPGVDAAGQAHHAYLRVGGQLLAHDWPIAENDIKYSLRQPDLLDNFRKDRRVDRRDFAGLQHDGMTGNQRWRCFTRDKKEGEVPRQNAGGDANRLFEHKDIFIRAIALHDIAFVTARPLRHIVQVVGGKQHLGLRQPLRFAPFGDNRGGQLRLALANPGGDLMQPDAALHCWQRFPARLRRGGGVDSAARVLRAAFRHLRDDRFRRRVDHLNPRALMRLKFAVDKHLFLTGGHLPLSVINPAICC